MRTGISRRTFVQASPKETTEAVPDELISGTFPFLPSLGRVALLIC